MIKKFDIKQNWIAVLGGLLVLQIALAVGLHWGIYGRGAHAAQVVLASVDKDKVDAIRVADGKSALVLRKQDGQWQLPDIDFPADARQVERLLEQLAGMKKEWPVATSNDAAERFKVSEKAFEREIRLQKDDKVLAKLYFGDAAGPRKVYARRDGDDEIHAVAFNAHEIALASDAWVDKNVLKRPADQIASVALPGVEIKRRDDGQFAIQPIGKDQEPNAKKAQELVDKLAGLQIQSLLGKQNKPEFGLDNPKAVVKLALKDGKPFTYTVAKPKGKDYYVLKSSERHEYFAVAAHNLDPILKIERNELLQAKTDKNDGATAVTPGETASETAKPSNS